MSICTKDSQGNPVVVAGMPVIDSALDSTSENPVQNKVIKSALDGKVDSTSLATVATSGSYNDLSNKPTIPDATSISYTGTASASAVRYQRVGIGSSYTEINGTKYMEQTKTLSTSATTAYTFTNSAITTSSVIDPYCSIYGLVPTSITVSSGSCTVTMPNYSSATSCQVRIYIR